MEQKMNQKRVSVIGLVLGCGVVLSVMGCENNYRLREDGRMAVYHGDISLAEAKYSRAVEREPDDYRAQYELGKVYLSMGKPVSAQMSFEQGMAVMPDNDEWTPRFIDGVAESLFQQKRFENLAGYLKDKADYYGVPRDYVRQGAYLAKMGMPDEAELAYIKAAHFSKGGKQRAQSFVAMSDFYVQVGNLEKAKLALQWAYYEDMDLFGLGDKFRKLGMIPGPTMAVEPPARAELD